MTANRILLFTLLTLLLGVALVLAWAGGDTAPHTQPDAVRVRTDHELPAERLEVEPTRQPSTPVVRATGIYRAAVGTGFRYLADVGHRTAIGQADGDAQVVEQRLRGDLSILLVAREATALILALSWVECTVSGADGGRPLADDAGRRVAIDLRKTCFVRMATDGQTLGYHFPPGFALENRSWVRTVVSAMRQVVPENKVDSVGTWHTTEVETSGAARFEYSWLDGVGRRLAKRKLGSVAQAQTEVRGKGEATYDEELGWFTSRDYSERTRLHLADVKLEVTQDLRASFELDSVIEGGTCFVPDEFTWQPASGQEDAQELAAARQRSELAAQLAATSLPQLVQEIQELVGAEGIASPALIGKHALLSELLQRDDAAVEKLVASLYGRLPAETVAVLVGALGHAGTPACQAALLACVDQHAPQLRQAATLAMFELKAPQPAVIAAMRHQATATVESPVRNSSLLLLGHFASTQDGRDGLASLLAMRDTMANSGRLETWILAVGNSRRPEAAPRLLPLLRDQRPGVRATAVEALLGLAANEGDQAQVRTAAIQDASPVVRRVLLSVLQRQPKSARADATLRALLRVERDSGLRAMAEQLLGRKS